mmetsp:Transcript_96141/g.272168  ORF Transcript_96141/g.272168 Transcript_96141/m.272168 type:complete len:228 (+) Transcript_96141:613-1296(+)
MHMTNDTGYQPCFLGSSMSGMVTFRLHLTGNWNHSTHSMRRSATVCCGSPSTISRRSSLRRRLSAWTHASSTGSSLAVSSRVMRRPRCESCWCTCSVKTRWLGSRGGSQYRMSSRGIVSQGASCRFRRSALSGRPLPLDTVLSLIARCRCWPSLGALARWPVPPLCSLARTGESAPLLMSGPSDGERIGESDGERPPGLKRAPSWSRKLGGLMRPPWCQWCSRHLSL